MSNKEEFVKRFKKCIESLERIKVLIFLDLFVHPITFAANNWWNEIWFNWIEKKWNDDAFWKAKKKIAYNNKKPLKNVLFFGCQTTKI